VSKLKVKFNTSLESDEPHLNIYIQFEIHFNSQTSSKQPRRCSTFGKYKNSLEFQLDNLKYGVNILQNSNILTPQFGTIEPPILQANEKAPDLKCDLVNSYVFKID